MASVESVVGKLCHQRENLLRLFLFDPAFDGSMDKLLFVHGHLFALFLTHCAAH